MQPGQDSLLRPVVGSRSSAEAVIVVQAQHASSTHHHEPSNQDPDHIRTSRPQLVAIGAVFAGQTASEPCTTSRPRTCWLPFTCSEAEPGLLPRPLAAAIASPWRSAQGVSTAVAARRGIGGFPQNPPRHGLLLPFVAQVIGGALPQHNSPKSASAWPTRERQLRGGRSNSCDTSAMTLTLRQESQHWVSIRLTKPAYRWPNMRTQRCPPTDFAGAIGPSGKRGVERGQPHPTSGLH